MNAGKKGEGSSRSGFTRNRLLGALGHVHNPFSLNSHRDQDVEDYRHYEITGNLRTIYLQVEVAKAEAFLMAQNLVARFQKS